MDRLSIGYFASAGTRWLPELVAYLENRYPHTAVQLNLAEGPWRELSSDIQVVISDRRELRFPVEVDSSFLVEDPYVVAVPDDHPIASRASISLAELEGMQWIDNDIGDGPCRTILFDACARAGVQIHFKHEAHSFPTALHMVSRGLGITVLPRLGIDPLPPGVRIVPLAEPAPTRYIHAISDPGHPQQALIADAISALRDLAVDDTTRISSHG